MPKKAKELGPLAVKGLTEPGLHAVGGVAGLHLQVSPSGARSWLLRITIAGRRRDMGLGGFPDVPLADARERARKAREKVREGVDPIEELRAARSALQASLAAAWTFKQCAEACIKAKAPEWSNAKHAAQWSATLAEYAYPAFGDLLVRDVDLPHVLAAIEPIWTTKTETATRVRGRIETVLDWATVHGYRHGPNPARWKGHLSNILAAPRKVAKVEHHAALPAAAMPAFMQALRKAEGTGARALEFAILTAARSGEVRGARWSELDLDAALWVVPAERMKAKREHRVPLSRAAVKLLRALPRLKGVDLVFPAPGGGQLSDMTLTAVTRRMGVDAVPHGFRSTFRDWAAESTNHPHEVAEMALAHAIKDKTEAAYRRGDLFAKRAALMQDWATFLAKPPAVVTPIATKRAARSAALKGGDS